MVRIPVYQPCLTGNEAKYVADCIDSTWISSKGEYLGRFESEFASQIKVRHATAVSNGTVALHLALVALGIGKGDEVIVPTLTYVASVNSISYTGGKPVFVDSLQSTWQMDPADIRRKITKNTRAIMVVHLYGHPCEMDEIIDIARENKLFVIEDCAEAFGSKYLGTTVGSLGNISTFSFFGNKTITTGEGGMVATNDKVLYERAVHYKGQGLARSREYWHDVVGFNYRMTNICAAIGLAQLERADEFVSRKRVIAQKYREGLNDIAVDFQNEAPKAFHSYWMTSILTETESKRDELRAFLAGLGIETRPLFQPVHRMPMYYKKCQRYEVADNLASRGLNLPSWPGLLDEAVTEVILAIRRFYNE